MTPGKVMKLTWNSLIYKIYKITASEQGFFDESSNAMRTVNGLPYYTKLRMYTN